MTKINATMGEPPTNGLVGAMADALSSVRDAIITSAAHEYVGFMGSEYFSIDPDAAGSGFVIETRKPDGPFDAPVVGRGSGRVAGNAFTLPLNPPLLLNPGLVLISGKTSAGKTSLVRALRRAVPGLIKLNAVEPFDEAREAAAEHFHSADLALAHAIARQMARPDRLPVIDSLRGVLFELTGAASSKGMTARFFTMLTRVSNSLAAGGRTIVATVNPMNSDADVTAEFLDKLSAATSSLIIVESRTGDADEAATFSGYAMQRPLRKKVPFTFSLRDGAIAPAPIEYTFEVPEDDGPPVAISRTSMNALQKV